ncbi:PepSY domain-containing protein [Pseudomonas sp.]|uniref:PepSY domain-containing protein n=1 Tax=Pseudomonas sp. TaxID=306 RepID=UPI002729F1C4|nr:PepSY domain-containing protein [Pseudomonas sp.]
MKRYLYLWHRWLGIALCLLMLLWFVSGMVMLYVGYPKLTQAEHWSRLPALSLDGCCVEPQKVLGQVGAQPGVLRLTSIAGAPHYLFAGPGWVRAFDGRTGLPVESVSVDQAIASARQFAPGEPVRYERLVNEDTWSHSRGLDADRPLHRVRVDDEQQRLLYVSGVTGAVVRDVTRTERIWNWLGAWLHWIYPLRGNAFDRAWHDIVVYLSVTATLAAVLGLVVGLLRWRLRRPYRNGSRSPYPAGWMRWHHWTGLSFGLVLLFWIFSGLMSMSPWGVLASTSRFSPAAYQGSALYETDHELGLAQAMTRLTDAGLQLHELEWVVVQGQAWLVGYQGDGTSMVISLQGDGSPMAQIDQALLQQAAKGALPGAAGTVERLHGYDFYYLGREQQSMYGARHRPLPALRIRFEDEAGTWVHIDPASGKVLDVLDNRRRLYRWMFNLLHSWDIPWLLDRPRLREGLLIVLSLGGALVSASGVVIGWRRLRRAAR